MQHDQHHHHHVMSNVSPSVVKHYDARSSAIAAESSSLEGTVKVKAMTEVTASGAPFESMPIPTVSRLADDDIPSKKAWHPNRLSTPSLGIMAIADNEAPEVASEEEGGAIDTPPPPVHDSGGDIEAPPPQGREGDGDGDQELIPVALTVSPPPELLERIHELEDKQRVAGEAIPVDMDEQHRMEDANRRKQRWIVGGCMILALAILGTVLGVTLGRKSPPSPTPETAAPTPTPTSDRFASLKTMIESVSFDGGAALSDPLSPQYKALTWLDGNEHLMEYSTRKAIQRYVLAVFYYSASGEGWTESDGWLTDEDECTWFSHSNSSLCDESGAFLRLRLEDNNLVGSLPSELALLSDSLLHLRFKDDMLTGTLATELGLLTNVEFFQFYNTDLRGTIPTELGRLKMKSDNGTAFYLEGNSLSGTIPPEVVAFPGVQYLSLAYNNDLTGSIPSEIGIASSLLALVLVGTKLEGKIPTELGKLVALEDLFLASNMLSGPIPSEVGLLVNLEGLYLSGNLLSGSIPDEIGRLTNLLYMEIENNWLRGPIPSSIGNLSKLQHLSMDGLGGSGLNGTIPAELGNLSSACM
jgi:hypothetical protein